MSRYWRCTRQENGLSKRKVDKVVEDAHWEGFQHGLSAYRSGLEYASTSGLYSYNGIRRIAYDAGWQMALDVLTAHDQRRVDAANGKRSKFGMPFEYKIPGSVFAECYGEARLAVAA